MLLDERDLELALDPDLRDLDQTHRWVTEDWNPDYRETEGEHEIPISNCNFFLVYAPVQCEGFN
jgi:hypothetical protein